MKEYKISIPAGGVYPFCVMGNFFSLTDTDGDKLRVMVKDSEYFIKRGQGVRALPLFDKLDIYNDSAVSVEASILIGVGEFIDNQIEGRFEEKAAGSFVPLLSVTMGAGVETVAANADRIRLGVWAARANTGLIWVGGVAGSGFPLSRGDYFEIKAAGDVDLVASVAGDVVYMGEWAR